MDFFETLLGIAPDGGDGMLEFLLFAIPIVGIAYFACRRHQRRQREKFGATNPPSPTTTDRL
jgi:hypothetical protein